MDGEKGQGRKHRSRGKIVKIRRYRRRWDKRGGRERKIDFFFSALHAFCQSGKILKKKFKLLFKSESLDVGRIMFESEQ
jgi:hypothetical protein